MALNYLSKDITLNLNDCLCIGCELCSVVCPHRVFQMQNNKSKIIAKDKCIECGACASNCPTNAIQLNAGVGCAIAVMASKNKRKLLKWME